MQRFALLPLLALGGCFGPGLLTDGTSVSHGTAWSGVLRAGAELPMVGDGYAIAPSWRRRQANHGTDELVDAIIRIARRLEREAPGSELYIGDLSYPGGRSSPRHHSHRTGRDVDLFYFAVDEQGRPLGPIDAMVPYSGDGQSRSWRHDGRWYSARGRRFDDARNWALVRALLTDPGIEVQWLFAHQDLIARILQWATAHGEDPGLVARAAAVMVRPAGALPHDDHLHVRIFCDPADRMYGCVDAGPQRWMKKQLKYTGSRALARLDEEPPRADAPGAPATAGAAAAASRLPRLLRWIALSPIAPLLGRW